MKRSALFAVLTASVLCFYPWYPNDPDFEFRTKTAAWDYSKTSVPFRICNTQEPDPFAHTISQNGWEASEGRLSPADQNMGELIYQFELPGRTYQAQLHFESRHKDSPRSSFIRIFASSDGTSWLSLSDKKFLRPQKCEQIGEDGFISCGYDFDIPSKVLNKVLFIKFAVPSQENHEIIFIEQWGLKVWNTCSLISAICKSFEANNPNSASAWQRIWTSLTSRYSEVKEPYQIRLSLEKVEKGLNS